MVEKHTPSDEPTQAIADSGPQEAPPLAPESEASKLIQILDDYAADLQAGRPADRDKLLAEHPELADELTRCLASIEFIHGLRGRGSFSRDDSDAEYDASREKEPRPRTLGDFRILRELGRGGMGVVFEAEQVSLKRRVALKVLTFGTVADEEAMQRFRREAETVATLHHTNIVPIFAIGNEESIHYYAMQLIEGRSLAEVATQRGRDSSSHEHASGLENGIREKDSRPLPPSDVADWGLQAAEALAHAHARGVVHRDVKPSNLILDHDGCIWLTDFGLAKRQQDVTLSVAGAIMGTPRYMSPEQAAALDKAVDHRTDIYSLGASLYELVTGQPIFRAESPHQVLIQILEKDPPRPRQVNPELPKDLETILLKCLAKGPEQRYQTARELADDLRAFTEGRPIRARQAGPVERSIRWAKKHRRPIGIATTSAAAAIVLILAALFGNQAYRESRMGELKLTTSGPQLIAEVLDQKGAPVRPGFSVPMTEQVSLPEGEYHLRLARPGQLSELWPAEIQRGEVHSHAVRLSNRWVWPPLDLRPEDYPEVLSAAFEGGTDFVIVRHVAAEGSDRTITVERRDGATGQNVWPRAFAFDADTMPQGEDLADWKSLLTPSTMLGQTSRLLPDVVDVNGDGTRDLIFASHQRPSVVAVSGVDGRLLWWNRSEPPLPAEHRDSGNTLMNYNDASLVSLPKAYDVNGDGTLDFLCVFAIENLLMKTAADERTSLRNHSWIVAVNGATGEALWSHALPPGSVDMTFDSETFQQQFRACRPIIVQARGHSVALMLLARGRRLLGIDVERGELSWDERDLERLHDNVRGIVPLFAPRVVSAGRGGRSGLLLVFRALGRQSVRLGYWDLESAALHWTKEFELASRIDDLLKHRKEEWILAVGSTGGEPASILMPTAHVQGKSNERWSGVHAIDAATGESRWQCKLALAGIEEPPPIERLLPGPDLNGDDQNDLFAAWTMRDLDHASDTTSHQVAAISSKDGQVLWRFRQARAHRGIPPDRNSSMRIWQAGDSGWPYLLVPVADGPGNRPVTIILSSADGQLVHTLVDVQQPEVGDLDGDGILDIFFEESQEQLRRLVALRGQPPVAWSQLGSWHPVNDLDNDDRADLVQLGSDRLAARAGKSGRLLWKTSLVVRDEYSIESPPVDIADLNGDSVADLFVFDTGRTKKSRFGRQTFRTVSAVSGRDGAKLWTAEDFGMITSHTSGGIGGRAYEYPTVLSQDITGDGRAEALVLQSGLVGRDGEYLSVIDGGTGELLWQHPFVGGTLGARGLRLESSAADLDGDGANDLLLWSAENDAGSADAAYKLVAVSGKRGQVLWTTPTRLDQRLYVGYQPVAVDFNGDGAYEIVYAYRQEWNGEFYPAELHVVDGRTGRNLGTWQWRATGTGMAPLAAPRLAPEGRRVLCVPINHKDEDGRISQQAVFLDVQPKHDRREGDDDWHIVERDRFEILPDATLDTVGFIWNAVKLNDDHREALLYRSDGNLVLHGGDQVLWTWPLPEQATEFVGFRDTLNDHGSEITVWSGKAVYGLTANGGRPVWRCGVAEPPQVGVSSSFPQVHLVSRAGGDERPNVLFAYVDHVSYRWRTVLRRAWPCNADGTYLAPTKSVLELKPIAEAAAPLRPLPWIPTDPENGIPAWLIWPYFVGGLGSLWVLVLPLSVVVWIIRRRAWQFGWLPSVVAAAGWILPPEHGVATLVAMLVPLWLVVVAIREARFPLWGLAILYALLTCLPLAYLIPDNPIAEVHPWGKWWWLDEMVGEPLTLASATIPGVLFWFTLVRRLSARDWRAFAVLLGSSVLFAIVFATVTLVQDRAFSRLERGYSLRGWWQIWFAGAFATGVLVLVVRLVRRGWRRSGLNRKALATAPS